MEYLIEMANAGIKISIHSPNVITYGKWYAVAEKESNGVTLKIVSQDEELSDTIENLYYSWKKSIGSLPEHGLKQITLEPETSPEIPF